MTKDDAVRYIRSEPKYASLVYDSYMGEDVLSCAHRFFHSDEFSYIRKLLKDSLSQGKVLDLGAGNGIASFAFASCGAKKVYALEPDRSDEVGAGAIRRIKGNLPIEVLSSFAEEIPLADSEVDIAYARQVLHHVQNLPAVMREVARVLKTGGVFIACREHVIDKPEELQVFLDEHIMHQLSGGENALYLDDYLTAINSSGLKLEKVFDPWDTIVNAFPIMRSEAELKAFPKKLLKDKFGFTGSILAYVPGIDALVWHRIRQHKLPGRLYSFFARKP